MAYVTRRARAEQRKKKIKILFTVVLILLVLCAALFVFLTLKRCRLLPNEQDDIFTAIQEYDGSVAYVEVNGNKPFFEDKDLTTSSFEEYSDLDGLERCGVAYACVGPETMPTESRGEIGQIKPTGWVQNKYDGIVDSKPPYLYNRCHLIAYCLTAENANEKNLITGTRYMNVEGMLPFEEEVAKYIDDTNNHVMYRVTPYFEGTNLLANGVLMEAYSVEDDGVGICFCVYCYNIQPGVEIDYKTGENRLK